MSSFRFELNCDKLLSLASKLEEDSDSFHFGHPPKPELELYLFRDIQISLLLAQTAHYVCSQVVIDADTRNSEPHVLLTLDGQITATCLVELAEQGNSKSKTRRLLIIVGSSSSQLHIVEVSVSSTGFKRSAPWQPLPLKTGLLDPKGVTSIVSHDIKSTKYVWISYADGTLLRLPAEALTEDYEGTVEDTSVLKVQTLLPDSDDAPSYKIVPCQACPSMWMMTDPENDEYFSALVYPVSSTCTGLGDPPTLMVYTSVFVADERPEDENNGESELLNKAIDATSSFFRGFQGALRWGLASSRNKPVADSDDSEDDDDEIIIRFPQAYKPATMQLTAAYELHDAPRQIITLKIRNDYAVMTDNLGRVQLLDLRNHFQVVRLWKGHRDATCVWSGNNLVLYSQQRRSVEVYPLPHGKRIVSKQLSRNAEIVQCHESRGDPSCCVLGADEGDAPFMLKELVMDTASPPSSPVSPSASLFTPDPKPRSSPTDSPTSSIFSPTRDAKLQMLQQMMEETHVQCTKEDVFITFSQISNLQQFCTALDLLCVSAALEDRMQAKGSDFQEKCVTHCRKVLEDTTTGKGADVTQSPPVLELKSRLVLHSQLIGAYKVLHQFEKPASVESDDDTRTNPKSKWAIEGMAWLQTYETVANRSMSSLDVGKKSPMSFSAFCRCCNIQVSATPPRTGKHVIQLSDSSRTRKQLLSHLFEPLLRDSFSFTVVNDIVDKMGFEADSCQMYLGEWFMSISPTQAAHKAFFALQPPIARWIQDLVANQVYTGIGANQALPNIILSELHTFCCDAEDLVRAFLLATVCREGISVVVKKREVKTYGKVWKSQAVAPWDELLRKIRMCLLLSLRLYGIPLGHFPITIKNIEDGEIFSIYELVARDELACSHRHEEIVSLEKACKNSGFSFDPSTSVGDDPSRWKALQRACMASAISEAERAEYLVELETDVQGALLLYLSHYNTPSILCAHRALLLAQQWIEDPMRLELLRDCLDALASLEDDATAGAVRHEVWQTCIRPVFRAFLFGFDDVQEIQQEVYSPLMENKDWMVRVGKAGLSFLSLIERPESASTYYLEQALTETRTGWPAVETDPVLQRLAEKVRPVNQNALNVHRVILSGCMVSSDVATLSECVDGFYEAFVSLLQPTAPPGGDTDKQMEFLEQAIIGRAETLEKPVLDRFELDEIETLALLWSIDVRDVRTIFLLAMYELGKDAVVDELLTHMSSQRGMDLTRFLEDGIGLVCRRLHQVLHVKRSRETRTLLGMLDADTTEWIRTAAEGTVSLLEDDHGDRVVLNVPLQLTHFFVLRLMSVAVSHADKETRVKLHSLSILSGTLLKELETQHD
jgi:hypothetical protein